MATIDKRTANPLLRRRWVRVTTLILVLLIGLLFLLPIGAKYYLADWLVKNGAEKASIEKLWFNPFVGKLTLGGVNVESDGKPLLQNSDMVLDIGISSLFSKDIRVEHGRYVGLMIDLEQYEDGRWRYGSYTMSGKKEKTEVDSAEDVASAWAFLADKVTLENCSVFFRTPDLDFALQIESAELKRFTTRDGDPAGTFNLKGTLNGEDLELQLDTLQVVPGLKIGGMVKVAKFNFEEIAKLLEQVLPTFKGETALQGKVLFTMSDEEGMKADYDGVIEIATPDIGMDSFSTAADNLKWDGKILYQMPNEGPMVVETDGTLSSLNYNLQLPETSFLNSESLIELSGKTKVEIAENVVVRNEGVLRIEGSELLLPGLTIAEDALIWKGQVLYESNHEGDGQYVHTDGLLELGPFQYMGGEAEAAIAAGLHGLTWQGNVTYGMEDEGRNAAVDLDGTLQGEGVNASLEQQLMTFVQEKIEVTSKSKLTFGEKTDISGSSSFTLENFQMLQGKEQSQLVALERLAVDELEGRGGKKIGVKELLAEQLKTTVQGNFPLDINVPQIQLTGFVTEDLANFAMTQLRLKEPRVVALVNQKELLHLADISIKESVFSKGGDISSESVDFQDFVFLGVEEGEVEKPGVTLKNAQLSGISWSSEQGFTGENLEFEDLVTTIIRDKEGKINISERLAAMQVGGVVQKGESGDTDSGDSGVGEADKVAAVDEKQSGVPIKLGKVQITGKSNLNFEDYTLAVPYITDLVISKFEVGELDSTRPDLNTNISLEGELEKRAPVNVSGHISPFKQPISMDMKLKLKNYPLSSLSAYTVQSVGTALASGQLELATEMSLAENYLDIDNNILLKKLETKMISEDLAKELDNQLPIPLDSALSILRDSKKNIDLDIPLEGPVDDLGVGVADVLITALGKAIVPAASGYLMYTLGPYGALAYVGMKVGEKMMQVDLPPVEFVPGTATLTGDHREYLERIAKILQDRPDTDIQLCPRVGSWELMVKKEIEAIKENEIPIKEKDQVHLNELGQARATAVQTHLSEDHSIDKSRLLVCETLIENSKDAVPALLLQM